MTDLVLKINLGLSVLLLGELDSIKKTSCYINLECMIKLKLRLHLAQNLDDILFVH